MLEQCVLSRSECQWGCSERPYSAAAVLVRRLAPARSSRFVPSVLYAPPCPCCHSASLANARASLSPVMHVDVTVYAQREDRLVPRRGLERERASEGAATGPLVRVARDSPARRRPAVFVSSPVELYAR